MKKSNKMLITIFSICLMLLVVGFSYAFFIYNKTGVYTHTITGGKMKVIYDEFAGNNITIENAYPRTDEEALTKGLEFEFTVTGYNESEKNIYYAIEMDYGEDIENKTRFKDTDIKLTLYENEELVFENEIFDNLDNQTIYYGDFKAGTDSQNPTINNYRMRLWINDYVIISDTIKNELIFWDDNDWDWFSRRYATEENFENDLYRVCPDFYDGISDECSLNDFGMNVYTSDEFANHYVNFKVNVKANLTAQGLGMLFYDANGGEFTPKPTSLATNRVTMQKPVMENKGFLGWSTTVNGEVEYKSGEYYNGEGRVLYAVYSDIVNVMGTFPTEIIEQKEYINEVYFINDTEENIDLESENADLVVDLTYDEYGRVLGLLFDNIIYIASEGTTYLSDCCELFYEWSNVEIFDFSNIDSTYVTDMSYMFYMCFIDGLDLSAFNTVNVVNMSYMFSNSSWDDKKLDLSGFNTSNVEDMSGMFSENCFYNVGPGKKYQLNLDNWDTSNVISMNRMFERVNSDFINLSHFDTSNVTDMGYMFSGHYTTIYAVDISNFDVSNVEDMTYLFHRFSGEELDLSDWNFSNVTEMNGMFLFCDNLKKVNLKNSIIIGEFWNVFVASSLTSLNLENAKLFDYVSFEYSDIESIGPNDNYSVNTKNIDTTQVTSMAWLFGSCDSLIKVDISNFDTSNVIDMSYMFHGCHSLTTLDLNNFNTENVTTMSGIFESCTNLTTLDLSKFDTSKVTNMSSMFDACGKLSSLDLSHFDTSKVTNMSSMFEDCGKLSSLDLSHFDTSQVTSMSYMFNGCSLLITLDIKDFDTDQVTGMSYMFSKCSSLVTLDISNFNTNQVTVMSHMFSECSSLVTLDISNFNTSQVTDISGMFEACSSLVAIDVSYFDTKNVTNMKEMFRDCTSLSTLDLSNWDTSSLKEISSKSATEIRLYSGMFQGCTNLRNLDISSFDFDIMTNYRYAFFGMNNNTTIYVGDVNDQTLILGISITYRPSSWTTSNVIVKSA